MGPGVAACLAVVVIAALGLPGVARDRDVRPGGQHLSSRPLDQVRSSRLLARTPRSDVTVLADSTPATLALATSRTLLSRAPTVVVAPATDPAAQSAGRAAALGLHAPLLLTGPDDEAVRTEVARLRARQVVAVGTSGQQLTTPEVRVTAYDVGEPIEAPATDPIRRSTSVLAVGAGRSLAATTTARVAGARVRVVRVEDPRTDRAASRLLRSNDRVVVLGRGFGAQRVAASLVRTARRGLQLPGGGQVVFPGRRMVALYGHPGTPSLGVLGEQGVASSVRRARRISRPYATIAHEPVIPTFELIATVASGGPGRDHNYSYEASPAMLGPWVAAAHRAGMYVVLDLQPGRSTFLAQAKRYARLLQRPYVGLALDPEWRLHGGQKPLRQIGSVDAREVNAVSAWLARLTRAYALPQKLLVVHQFQSRMLAHRSRLDVSHPEVALLIHADGQGGQGAKRSTWRSLHHDAPAGVSWGWKNFYDEDTPTLSPRKTYAVHARPDFVSYQ